MNTSARALLHSTLLSAVAVASTLGAGCGTVVGRTTFNFGGRPVEWWNAKTVPGVTYLALREAPDVRAQFGGDVRLGARGAILHEHGAACQAVENRCPYVVEQDPSRRTTTRPSRGAPDQTTGPAGAECVVTEAECPTPVRVALANESPGRSVLLLRDGAVQVVTADDFASAFGAVDSEEKAVLRLWLARYEVVATIQSERAREVGAQARAVDGGFEVWTESETTNCGGDAMRTTEHRLIFVARDGAVTQRESRVVDKSKNDSDCHPLGRRPEGFAGAVPSTSPNPFARYFARAAQLEGAAVPAFERLARELESFGAPDDLCRRALASAQDEREHCATMSAFYEGHAGTPADPSWPRGDTPRGERKLEELAIENAVEGCVLECFAAAIALCQAERAVEPALRLAFARIADDEVEHGALAWDIHRWALEALDEGARGRVIAALNKATHELCDRVATRWLVDDAQAWAGEPHAPGALHLARVIEALSEHIGGGAPRRAEAPFAAC